jgi:hypothetical protein
VYFIYKLVRLFQPTSALADRYAASQRTLGVFSILSLLMLFATLALTIKCYSNFGHGLKEHRTCFFRLYYQFPFL